MVRAAVAVVLNLARAFLRPLVPLVQALFGMTREAARKAVVKALEIAMLAALASVLYGANFFGWIRSELLYKADKGLHESSSRIDQMEKEALANKPSPKGSSNFGTGGIQQDEARKKAEADCNVQKAKEVSALVSKRLSTWDEYTTCLTDTKLGWGETRTVKQICAPKFDAHQALKQEVIERQAKDCSTTASK